MNDPTLQLSHQHPRFSSINDGLARPVLSSMDAKLNDGNNSEEEKKDDAAPLSATTKQEKARGPKQDDVVENKDDEAKWNAAAEKEGEFVSIRLLNPKKQEDLIRADRSPLILAARLGNATMVKTLIGEGADVNAKDEAGYTALMRAIESGSPDTVSAVCNTPPTKKNFWRKVQQLEVNADSGFLLNVRFNETALMIAARQGDKQIIDILVTRLGKNLEKAKLKLDRSSRNAFMYAAQYGHAHLIPVLFPKGQNTYIAFDHRPSERRTGYDGRWGYNFCASDLAAANGHITVLKELFSGKADFSDMRPESVGHTTLMNALIGLKKTRDKLAITFGNVQLQTLEQNYVACIRKTIVYDPGASLREYSCILKKHNHRYVLTNAILYALSQLNFEDIAGELIDSLPAEQGKQLDDSFYQLTASGECPLQVEPMNALDIALLMDRKNESLRVGLVLKLLQKGARKCPIYGNMADVIAWLKKVELTHPADSNAQNAQVAVQTFLDDLPKDLIPHLLPKVAHKKRLEPAWELTQAANIQRVGFIAEQPRTKEWQRAQKNRQLTADGKLNLRTIANNLEVGTRRW